MLNLDGPRERVFGFPEKRDLDDTLVQVSEFISNSESVILNLK